MKAKLFLNLALLLRLNYWVVRSTPRALFFLLLLAGLSASGVFSPAPRVYAAPLVPRDALARAQRDAVRAERLLNTDGTLNLTTGFQGNLDLTGWDVRLDNEFGVRLSRQSAPAERAPVDTPPADGFQNMPQVAGTWSALGSGLNSTVFAIAISGSDVYAGGNFVDAGGDANADYIAKFTVNAKLYLPLIMR